MTMELSYEEFVAAGRDPRGEVEDGKMLALYAYVGGKFKPPITMDDESGLLAWQALHTADTQCGRALPLSERDRARAEATMLGLTFDESAQLPPPELPDEEDDPDPATSVAIVATLVEMMGGEFTEADASQLLEQMILEDMEYATAESERWASASDRLHRWQREMLNARSGTA
jgi:hypothetical protein